MVKKWMAVGLVLICGASTVKYLQTYLEARQHEEQWQAAPHAVADYNDSVCQTGSTL